MKKIVTILVVILMGCLSMPVLAAKTVPCELSFVYSTADGSKNITDSDFSYDKNTDDVKLEESKVIFKNMPTATSREQVTFEAGTYQFFFSLYVKDHGNYDLPKVTVNGVSSAVATISDDGRNNYTYEYTAEVTVATAGNYNVIIYTGNTNEKVRYDKVSISKKGGSGGDCTPDATPAAREKRIYLDFSESSIQWWKDANAKQAVYWWKGDGSSKVDGWVWMTPYGDNNTLYAANIPLDAEKVIFCRMKNDGELKWDDKWNQSVDATLDDSNDCYVLTSSKTDEKYTGSWATASSKGISMKTIYLKQGTASDGTNNFFVDCPHFGLHYWKNGSAGTWAVQPMQMGTGCYEGYYIGEVFSVADRVIVSRFDPNSTNALNFDNDWNESLTFDVSSNNLITIDDIGTVGDANGKGYGSGSSFALAQYTISYDKGTGSGTMSSNTSINCGSDQALTANSFSKTGYSFGGWIADVDVTVNNATVTAGSIIANNATIQKVTEDISLTAQWTPNTTTITLDKNGGDANQSVTATYDSGTLPSFTAVTRSGYILKGYYTDATGDTKVINADGTLVSNVSGYTNGSGQWIYTTSTLTLYAQWTQIDNIFITGTATNTSSTTYHDNEGSSLSSSSVADCAFDHNVLKLDYSGFGGTGKYYGLKITRDNTTDLSSANAGATGFGFYYKTSSSNDGLAFCIDPKGDGNDAQYKLQLPATNGTWKYVYIPHSQADGYNKDKDNGYTFWIWLNSNDKATPDHTDTSTPQSSGTFYLSEIAATTVTAKDDKACAGVSVTYQPGEHGSISATAAGVPFTSGTSLPQGTSLSFTATPDDGYAVSGWWIKEGDNESVFQGNTQGQTNFTMNVISNAFTVEVRFETPYAVTVTNSPDAGGSVSGAGSFVQTQNVILTAASNDGYTFNGWTDVTGVTITGHESDNPLTFVMPANAVSLTANYVRQTCTNTMRIECARDYVQYNNCQTNNEEKMGTPEASGGNGFITSGSGTMDYVFETSGSADVTFRVRLANVWGNGYPKLYLFHKNESGDLTVGGVRYSQYSENSLYDSDHQEYQNKEIVVNALPADKYIMRLTGENWICYDVVQITASSDVFCTAGETYSLTLPSCDNGTLTSDQADNTEIPEGTTVTITATGDEGYVLATWGDATVNGSATDNCSGTFTFTMPAEDVTLTAATFRQWKYVAWTTPAKEGLQLDITGDSWDKQLVLGPEHFRDAEVGDTLKVYVTRHGDTGDEKGALQRTTNYGKLSDDAAVYKFDGTQVATGEGTRDFTLPSKGYYHILTDNSLAILKDEGVIIKGNYQQINKVEILASCTHSGAVPSAPDKTSYSSFDTWTSSGGNFNLGTWDHQLEFTAACFANGYAGNVIRIQLSSNENTTISYRCNVDNISADSKTDDPWVLTWGDISFDRTIDNLNGDAPVHDYVDMYITEEMCDRLKESGLIIAGTGSIVVDVTYYRGPFVIGANEAKEVPSCGVDTLIIEHGGRATNDYESWVFKLVEYRRTIDANDINKWRTFCVPFDVNKITSSTNPANAGAEIWPYYYENKSAKSGYFYLQYLKDENPTATGEAFKERWAVIENKYPLYDSAYIMKFTDLGNSYFKDKTIHFYHIVKDGDDICKIAGVENANHIPAEGMDPEKFYFYPNNTLDQLNADGTKITSAYILSEDGTNFDLKSNPVIDPFTCYIQATESYKMRVKRLSFGGPSSSPTGLIPIYWDDQDVTVDADTDVEKFIYNNQVYIRRGNQIYDLAGRKVQIIR